MDSIIQGSIGRWVQESIAVKILHYYC